MPNLTIVDGKRILVVKPLVTRYWLERAASADAARIAFELQTLAPTPQSAPTGPAG